MDKKRMPRQRHAEGWFIDVSTPCKKLRVLDKPTHNPPQPSSLDLGLQPSHTPTKTTKGGGGRVKLK